MITINKCRPAFHREMQSVGSLQNFICTDAFLVTPKRLHVSIDIIIGHNCNGKHLPHNARQNINAADDIDS